MVNTSWAVSLVCNFECKIVQSLIEGFHLRFKSIDVFFLRLGKALLEFNKTTDILNFVFLLKRNLVDIFDFI